MRAGLYIGEIRGASFLALAMVAALSCPPASAQSLVEMYRTARFKVQAQEMMDRHGRRASPFPVERVPYASESVRQTMADLFAPAEPETVSVERTSFEIRKPNLIPKLARSWFERRFEGTRWSYLGSNDLIATDTTYTRVLRALMEAHFGAPTRTLADADSQDELDGEYVQFEYWFALNDTLPMIVMDVNGPFERGVVVATDQRYRALLPELKQALLGPMIASGRRAPYVDYYYLQEQAIWLLTGYDGERYFLERIGPPRLRLGRPLLETVLD